MQTVSHIIIVPLTHPSRAIRDLPSFLIRTGWQLSGAVRFRVCAGTICFFRHISFPRTAVGRVIDQVCFPFAPWLSFPSSSLPNQRVLPCFWTQITRRKIFSHPKRDVSKDFYLGCESGLGILRIFYSRTLADSLVHKTNSLFTNHPSFPQHINTPTTHTLTYSLPPSL